jgi:superkiller protein 3
MAEISIRHAVFGGWVFAVGKWVASVTNSLNRYRLAHLDTEDKYEDAYRYFITSLKRSPTYAPAFTSLGVYYTEALVPPELTRASKCFQKAFELDAREADAARRLAESFAVDMEWDLVEIVARRTIDGEGGLDAGVGDPDEVVAISKFLPTNAWAWKALGVVEIVRFPSL